MSITNVVETQLQADAAGYVAGIHAAVEELDKFIKKNALAGAQAKKTKGGFDDFAKGAANFIKQNRTLGDVIKTVGSSIAGTSAAAALAVAGIGAVGAAAVLAAKQAIQLADELQAVSQRTGTSVEALSALKIAAEDANVSFGSVQAGLRSLNRTISAAENNNKAAKDAFRDLGIQIRDAGGKLKTTDQIFREVAESVSKIEGPALKAGAAAGVLGRQAGPELVPLLNQGIKGMDAAREKAEAFGNVITARFAQQADVFGTNLKDVGRLATGLGISIAESLLPSVNALLESFTGQALQDLKGFRDLLGDIGFHAFRLTNALIALNAQFRLAIHDLPGQLAAQSKLAQQTRELAGLQPFKTKDSTAEVKRLTAEYEKASAALFKTKIEFEALGKAKTAPDVKPIVDARTALANLADAFRDLDKEAIAPVLAVARELAGDTGLGVLTDQFKELVAELQRLAKTSPAAAKALAEVLKLQQEVIAAQLQQGALPQGPVTEGGQGPQRVTEETRQQGIAAGLAEGPVQGPATRAGQGPQLVTEEAMQQAIADALQAGNVPQGPATETGEQPALVKLKDGIDAVHDAFVQAQLASDAFFKSTIDFTAVALQAMQQFATTFADALVDGANIAKLAFGKLFAQIFKDLAKAIIRALIFKAILAVFNVTWLGAITKLLTGALGGPGGFQDKESSITARASQAHGLAAATATGIAAPIAGAAAPSVTVQIHEPGPFTWAEATDRKVLPRLRERQRRLNEQPI